MRIPLHKSLLLVHDLIVIVLSIVSMTLVYSTLNPYFDIADLSTELILGFASIVICVLVTMNEYALYQYQVILNRVRHFTHLYKSLFVSLIAVLFLSFVFKFEEIIISRVLMGIIYLTILLVFIVSRVLIVPKIFFALVRKKVINRNLLIVGSGKLSTEQGEKLIDKHSYFNIRGVVNDGETELGEFVGEVPVVGTIKDLPQMVDLYNIQDILVASDCKSDEKLHDIIEACKKSNRTVHIVSELYNIATQKIEIEEIGKVSAFRYIPPQPGSRLLYPYAKRVFDLISATIIAVVLSPLWLLITVLVKLTSQGPLLYRATAVGKKGEIFRMYKFRSMFVNASSRIHEDMVRKMIKENGATTKLVGDPRITPIGKLLRKSSLDELPQLINVIKGEMSLVGPRPCLPYEYEEMKDWQKERCAILPGMTGIWQVKGRDEVLFNEQVILDLYYKEHRSLWMDLEIMAETIPVVLFGRGGG